MSALILAAALLASPAMAQELPASEPTPAGPAPSRLVLNGAVLGAGLGLAGAAAYNLTQANAAYRDYLAEPDATAATAILDDEVRPRQLAGIAEAGVAVAALGGGAILWATTEGLGAMPDDAPLGRYALNTAVLGSGAGLGVAAVYNYAQARTAYGWSLEEDDAAKVALYEDQLAQQRRAMAVEGLLSVACLGAGAALWAKTDAVSLQAGPGLVGFEARF
jgi:hypothetical protein